MVREFEDFPVVMSCEDVGELLGHPVKLIQVMAREGRLPAFRQAGLIVGCSTVMSFLGGWRRLRRGWTRRWSR